MCEKTKILIVDDEPINLDFFDVMLGKLGFQVEKAEDGEEALEKVKECNPDLIMLDNIIPKLSGWKVTRILKTHEEYKDYRDIPIIMFSAMDAVKDKIEGFDLGIEDYILKPFNFSEVLARIRAVLRHRELSKQILRKERKIALIGSLNKSLIFFTRNLKQPVLDLQNMAKETDMENAETRVNFIKLVIDETARVFASLEGLEEEINELENADDDTGKQEAILMELEEKFQKHFRNVRDDG